ncbi:MAG: hypothetical protein QGF59_28545 [Pirellulaceae bacterium]|nr:hypothetical protein [Pirellulaceae bacterium]
MQGQRVGPGQEGRQDRREARPQDRQDRGDQRLQRREQRPEDRQQRQEQRQDRANEVRQEWRDQWQDIQDDLFEPGWRLEYPELAHGYFHYNHPNANHWWAWASVGAVTNWFARGSSGGEPIYYDYGENVTYENETVYIDDQPVASADAYAQQAAEIANTPPPPNKDPEKVEWMPLGVFAVSASEDEKSPTRVIQLAVSKEGVIGGTFFNKQSGTALPVQGSVDRKTQRAAWTIGDNKNTVVETGVYNLTKDEADVLVHFGKEKTQSFLIVRLPEQEHQP